MDGIHTCFINYDILRGDNGLSKEERYKLFYNIDVN
jgi:hypothetical protein